MKKLLLLALVLLGGITQVYATTYTVTVIDGKGWVSGTQKMCAYMWNSSDDSKKNADFHVMFTPIRLNQIMVMTK